MSKLSKNASLTTKPVRYDRVAEFVVWLESIIENAECYDTPSGEDCRRSGVCLACKARNEMYYRKLDSGL